MNNIQHNRLMMKMGSNLEVLEGRREVWWTLKELEHVEPPILCD